MQAFNICGLQKKLKTNILLLVALIHPAYKGKEIFCLVILLYQISLSLQLKVRTFLIAVILNLYVLESM